MALPSRKCCLLVVQWLSRLQRSSVQMVVGRPDGSAVATACWTRQYGGDANLKSMRAVSYDEPGGSEKLYIGSVPLPSALKEGQLLVKVYASAINRADTLQRQGKYPPPPGESLILGLEAAGIVVKADAHCKRWQKGDRVMALLGGGGNAEYVAVQEELLMPVPDGMPFRDAAAIPETWLTAFQLLHFVGKVKAGDRVLVHAGGSGVGLAAVQLAKLASAIVYVTAGTDEKLAAAEVHGATQGFNYKKGPFVDDIAKATGGHGIDLILDCIGGSYWEQNSTLLAIDGHWIIYGLLGGTKVNGDLLARILRKRGKMEGTTLRSRSLQYKGELVQQFTEKIVPLLDTGVLRPIVDSEFPLGRIAEAHARMEAGKNIGKIVLLVRPEDDITDVHVD